MKIIQVAHDHNRGIDYSTFCEERRNYGKGKDTDWPNFTGGFHARTASHLQDNDCPYEIECWKSANTNSENINLKEIDGTKRRLFPSFWLGGLDISIKLAYNLYVLSRKENILIHFRNFHVPFTWIMIFLFRKNPIVVAHHGAYNPLYKMSYSKGLKKFIFYIMYLFEKFVAKYVDYFQPLTKTEASYLSLISKRKVKQSHVNGIDPHFKVINKTDARNKLNLPQNSKILLYIGFATKLKGLDILLKCKDWFSKNNIKVIVLGCKKDDLFYSETKNAFYEVKKYVDRFKLLNYYYSSADIFVAPSMVKDYYNFAGPGVAQLEAMACGTPVISSSLLAFDGGNYDGVGLVPKDITDFKKKVLFILSNPQLFKDTNKIALSKYSTQSITKNLINKYSKLEKLYFKS